ncbi:MAG: hypothetical protein R3208_16805 [Ketobacteraceae bacterium]|nr:hypothetical protein [Ketobacteraceae bacterium]
MSDYVANKGFIALFALLAALHLVWASYEWWWLIHADASDVAGSIIQFKTRWSAPLLTTLAMSAATLAWMVVRSPRSAMVMSVWFVCIAVLCHLGLLYFDPLRNHQLLSHWVPVIALGILAYKIIKRYQLSRLAAS